MGRGLKPKKDRPPRGPFGPPPDWPPPPGGWGPPPPEGWGPFPPEGWGPPPPGGWGPPPPGGWGPPPPGGWGPPPPEGWGPPPPEGWGPPPPEGWGPPPPGGWGPPPPGGWGPSPPGGWGPPPPGGWGPPEGWDPNRPPSPGWVPPPEWMPPPNWNPDIPPPPGGWEFPPWALPGSEPPPGFPLPPVAGEAYPPSFPPPGYSGPAWAAYAAYAAAYAASDQSTDKPEWIKALISGPGAGPLPPPVSNENNTADVKPAEAKSAVEKSADKSSDSGGMSKSYGLLATRSFDRPPPGRSTGIISFVGPSFGHIEREDAQKFTFDFSVFFGNPQAMKTGVRVHFTACDTKNGHIATDVKVAPGGTENVDPDIYEGVVNQPIADPQAGERQLPGQVHVDVQPVRLTLSFERKDSAVTLLKNDQVLINLLTDIVTDKRRATNIRPKLPETFQYTEETRETGVIVSLGDADGVIKSEAHGELPFYFKENFSDVDFTADDINEEVEFTLHKLRAGDRAIRLRRVKESLLLTLCGPTSKIMEPRKSKSASADTWLDTELYEGVVSQPVTKPSADKQGYPGQIFANIGPLQTNVTFDRLDCRVTLLKNDRVLLSLLVDKKSLKKRAANIRPKIPFTFGFTNEKRELGIIDRLGEPDGVLISKEHGELPFDLRDNFSDTEFDDADVKTEVEFTVVQDEDNKRAVRLRRTKMDADRAMTEKRRREEEEEKKKEVAENKERGRKEAAIAALAAAKDKWTPLGFSVPVPDTQLDISKERFDGTVLKSAGKRHSLKMEAPDQQLPTRVKKEEVEEALTKVKAETPDDQPIKEEGLTIKQEVTDSEQKVEVKTVETNGKTECSEEDGLLVMTVEDRQKRLPFGPADLLSGATLLIGDKVRFNVATNRESKEERATLVEILPSSFEESTEQRRHGIVIEFSEDSGLIKCTQNPQLFFYLSEVIGKRKLELNEKVEFSVVPHEEAAGGHQAIRVRPYSCTESVFLPAKKLGVATTGKGKMTIKLAKAAEDSKKAQLKTVVKQLRSQDKSRSDSPRRSPAAPKDKFGREIQKRRSPSPDHERRSSFRGRSGSRERSRERSRRRSRSRSRSSSRERFEKRRHRSSRERDDARRSSREREDARKRRWERNPPAPRVDDELARKKRELEELNQMIAFKKSLMDPRGPQPGQRTCIEYDHGRIANPMAEFRPVRSILKKRSEDREYPRRPYDDPYYDGPYYGAPFVPRPYDDRPYGQALYGSSSNRYDVYDEPYDEPYRDPADNAGPLDAPYAPSSSTSTPQCPPAESPAPSSTQKPHLDHFLDMIETEDVPEKPAEEFPSGDELLPHERALKDGKGFSKILGLPRESPGGNEDREKSLLAYPSVEKPSESKRDPYNQIQTLLRTIGLKLTTGDAPQKSSSAERERSSSPWERPVGRGAPEADVAPPPESSAPEPAPKKKKISEYEEFLDQQELEMLKKAQELQDLTKNMAGKSSTPRPPPGPPPEHYRHPSPPLNWPLEVFPKAPPAAAPGGRLPPGPPPGPPPRRPPGQPLFTVSGGAVGGSDPVRGTGGAQSEQCNISTTMAKCLKVIESVKSLHATPGAKTQKSVQFSLPSNSTAGPPEQSGDAANRHNDKKIEDLREDQPQARKKTGDGAGMTPGTRIVWIVGHTLVSRAESQAKSEPGPQLGLDPEKVVLRWMGVSGLTWPQLLPLLQHLQAGWPRPQAIVLHLGGNDLNTESPSDLLASVRRDLNALKNVFPHCVPVFSQILPRRAWPNAADAHEVELVRSTVNRRIRNLVSEVGGVSLSHDNIRCGANTGLYQPDGVHLSQKGIDVFNGNLRDFLIKWVEGGGV
ncbi:uncharacterized protein si:dkeyp-121d4.3 isoform X2 [Corythoichthys intestinalis]|uniref:uncharacterized protein si:dkeyp-121d4.3 isoform X2 n=1 Tax=Corythoichthys intestinalis TaxID=161448 RepID=UPI0025A5CE17|nr:uncharacterized protein si:dkeyp-121d4.3 isoform X2 [Corythoichthys intestinalis]